MTPEEAARIQALEDRVAQMDSTIMELKAKLESSHPGRIRVRKPRRFDPGKAIEAAEATDAHTFSQGMTAALVIAVIALFIWAGVEGYERIKDGVVVEVAGTPILP